jgi:hypothetical protein
MRREAVERNRREESRSSGVAGGRRGVGADGRRREAMERSRGEESGSNG